MVAISRLDDARRFAKEILPFVGTWGQDAFRFDIYKRDEDGELVPAMESEFLAWLDDLYAKTSSVFDRWQSLVSPELADAVLLATASPLGEFEIDGERFSTGFAAMTAIIRRLSETSTIARLTDVESGVLSVQLWLKRFGMRGFPSGAIARRIDAEWAVTRPTLAATDDFAHFNHEVNPTRRAELLRELQTLRADFIAAGSDHPGGGVHFETDGGFSIALWGLSTTGIDRLRTLCDHVEPLLLELGANLSDGGETPDGRVLRWVVELVNPRAEVVELGNPFSLISTGILRFAARLVAESDGKPTGGNSDGGGKNRDPETPVDPKWNTIERTHEEWRIHLFSQHRKYKGDKKRKFIPESTFNGWLDSKTLKRHPDDPSGKGARFRLELAGLIAMIPDYRDTPEPVLDTMLHT
jgi:hypothetical protein